MNRKVRTHLVREGEYVAEVEVELVETEGSWTPQITVEDAHKLDEVRDALRAGEISRASESARVRKAGGT